MLVIKKCEVQGTKVFVFFTFTNVTTSHTFKKIEVINVYSRENAVDLDEIDDKLKTKLLAKLTNRQQQKPTLRKCEYILTIHKYIIGKDEIHVPKEELKYIKLGY